MALRQIFLDPTHQEAFVRQGYVAVRLLTDEDVAELLGSISNLQTAVPTDINGRGYSLHTTFLHEDPDYRARAEKLVAEAFARRIDDILVGYRAISAGLIIKPPGAGDCELHHDWTMTRDSKDIQLNVWCPLVDVDTANGALRLIAGSHRIVDTIVTAHVPTYFGPYAQSLKNRATEVPLRAGEALIFDTTILHWSPVNTTAVPRPVAATVYVPKDAALAFYKIDKAGGRSRFEVFDMEDDGYQSHLTSNYFGGEIRSKRLGFVPNRNPKISLEDFEERLTRGDEIRRQAYAKSTGGRSHWMSDLTKWFIIR
jgi:hypothetical protein